MKGRKWLCRSLQAQLLAAISGVSRAGRPGCWRVVRTAFDHLLPESVNRLGADRKLAALLLAAERYHQEFIVGKRQARRPRAFEVVIRARTNRESSSKARVPDPHRPSARRPVRNAAGCLCD